MKMADRPKAAQFAEIAGAQLTFGNVLRYGRDKIAGRIEKPHRHHALELGGLERDQELIRRLREADIFAGISGQLLPKDDGLEHLRIPPRHLRADLVLQL